MINSNWWLTTSGVENREIHTNLDLVYSTTLNFNIASVGIGRVDLKVNDTGFAACVMTEKELLYVQMNGHHSVSRLKSFIEDESVRLVNANPDSTRKVDQEFFEQWVKDHAWGAK